MYLNVISNYLQLLRIRIALFAAFSAASAFLLARPHNLEKIIFVAAGIFLMACGASCLNQYQERATDALMERTKNRPLPSGMITPERAAIFSMLFTVAGAAILIAEFGFGTAIIGVCASVWYNGVYTYLKRMTAFAAVPGALTGALPPVVGWVAAGGNLPDSRLLALCLFFIIWQVPHFWLFLMGYGKQYEDAGLPSVTRIFRRSQMSRIIFHWIAATAVCGLALSLFGLFQSHFISCLLLAASAWLMLQAVNFLRSNGDCCREAFRMINLYMIVVMLLLISGSLPAFHGIGKYYAMITRVFL
ncbi:MAG TPA: protoheme IX farnesyltransferase [Dissulfurispiraceae bacterium]|nr:protoheme IX farnesyltransferase [Dissulfurispiraceae bacterium]